MKFIRKNKEPISLQNYKSKPGSAYDDLPNEIKNDIRLSLLEEQKGICAYCMGRISNNWNLELNKYKVEIEHFRCQDKYNGTNGFEDLRLSYPNMLGVCNGNAGNPKHLLHCDKSKSTHGEPDLTINPLNPSCEVLIKFDSLGNIESKDLKVQNDIVKVLNLNEQNLQLNRKVAIDEAFKSLIRSHQKLSDKPWKISVIQNEIAKWNGIGSDGLLKPYCQAVIYILNQKLNKIRKQGTK